MKKIYSLLVMMLIGFAASWAATSTLTFTKACGGSGTADDNVSWTVTSDGQESTYDPDKGIHYGTGKQAVQYIELSTSGITGTITEVKVNASTASGVTATASVTVGGAAFGGDAQSIGTSATDYTFTGSASGEIVVTVTKPSSATKAIYVKSVAVTYQEGGEPAETYAITYNEMENGSVTGPAEAAAGATVTLTVTPATGYQLATLTVEDANDVPISVSDNKFTMPAGPVYVSATFEEAAPVTGGTMTFVQNSKNDGTLTGAPAGVSFTYRNTGSNANDQLTANNNMTLTISGMPSTYKVTGVTLEVKNNASKGAGSATVTMDGNEIGSMQITGLGSTYQEKAVEITETPFSGDLVITIAATVNSVYCDKFIITYAEVSGDEPVVIAKPVISGTTPFTDQTEVTITCATDGASVYYTIDGSEPSATDGTLYTAAFTIDASCTVKAIATDGTNVSAIASKEFEKTEPVAPIMSIAEFNALEDNAEATFGVALTAIAQTGKYLYAQDENNGILIYGDIDQTYELGNVIPAGFSGKKTTYKGAPEMAVPLADFQAATSTVLVEPIEISAADLTVDNAFRYAVIKNAVVASGAVNDANGAAVNVYNRFGKDAPADGTYNITGVTGWYDGAQFMPLEYVAVESTDFYITATPPAGTYEGPQTVSLEGHNGEIDVATYTIDGNEDEIDYDPQTGIQVSKSCTLHICALDADGNEATLDAEYVINYPDVEIAVSPEAGTYYEAQNVHVTVAGAYGEDVLIGYKFAEGDQYIEYDDQAGIDITESCTLYVNVVTDYQDTEASFEYVITEAPAPLEGNGFVKVQSDAELISGQYLIVYENVDETDPTKGYAFDGSLEALDAANNYQAVTIAESIIEATDATKAIAFTYDAEAGTLKSASGLYIGKTANSNGLDASDTKAYTNTISIDVNANAEIKSSGNCYLMFNSTAGQTRFRYYKSQNQKAIALYILREEAQPEGVTLAEALAGGEGLISNDLTVAKVYNGKAYLTDGEDNWVSIEGGNADQLTPGAVIDGYQLSGIANPTTNPAINISEDVTFTPSENIPTIDELDLRGGIAEMPKAGKVVSIIGWYLQEDGQNVFSAYSGKNGSKGNTISLADVGGMKVGSEYTIEAAITLTEAWDAEQSAGAPRRVSPTSDDALKNITLSLVGEPVSTAVNDIAVDADVVSVKYVNVAGQVSAQPFDGINVVVTTYVDGTTKAVKVVK